MKKVRTTPSYLVSGLQKHANDHLKQLKHELDHEGWDELASLVSTEKGWIHRFIAKRSYLSARFKETVSKHQNPDSPTLRLLILTYCIADSRLMRMLTRVCISIRNEAFSLRTKLSSTRHSVSWCLRQYSPWTWLPTSSSSCPLCSPASCLRLPLYPRCQVKLRRPVLRSWQGTLQSPHLYDVLLIQNRYVAILAVFLTSNNAKVVCSST